MGSDSMFLQSGDTVAVVIREGFRTDGRTVETGVFLSRDDNNDIVIRQDKTKKLIAGHSWSMLLY